MLNFARTWQPYGGNDDQILPEFGIPATTFYQRVLALLSRPLTHGIEASECQAMRAFCVEKLRVPPDDTPASTPACTAYLRRSKISSLELRGDARRTK
jgi:hypothetical protein